jgi:hypothetical protein
VKTPAIKGSSERLAPRRVPALLVFVHLNSERTVEPVRKDCCFAEKQEPQPALLLAARCGRR